MIVHIWLFIYDRCILKQAYATKTYSMEAWQPLRNWLYGPTATSTHLGRLKNFQKTDTDLHTIVAKCLWRLSCAPNHPWGVGALHPSGYSDIPVFRKVTCQNNHSAVVDVSCLYKYIFFSHFNSVDSHMNIPSVFPLTLFICLSGLGFCNWGPPSFGKGALHEHGKLRQVDLASAPQTFPSLC